jgi:hypothetical protein
VALLPAPIFVDQQAAQTCDGAGDARVELAGRLETIADRARDQTVHHDLLADPVDNRPIAPLGLDLLDGQPNRLPVDRDRMKVLLQTLASVPGLRALVIVILFIVLVVWLVAWLPRKVADALDNWRSLMQRLLNDEGVERRRGLLSDEGVERRRAARRSSRDRRQAQISVAIERRSAEDRRSGERRRSAPVTALSRAA